MGSNPRRRVFSVAGSILFGGIFCVFPESKNLDTASISERAVEAVVVIEIGLVMPDGLPVMDIYNIVFKSLFGFWRSGRSTSSRKWFSESGFQKVVPVRVFEKWF